MTLGILDAINYGYRQLEPVIVGLMAMHKSFMLIGRHGTGKTRLARALSLGYGAHGFVFYDATKDDLVSIAGIPDPEALRAGRLRFVPHERAIWDKSTVVVDEITRAGKESQNLWLEILEERTCFGLPLAYRSLVATANPESYAAAFQLDEALLDRFHAVIPVPEHQDGVKAEDVAAMLKLSWNVGDDRPKLEAEQMARVFAEIQRAHAELIASPAIGRVADYLGQLVPALLKAVKEQNGPYISARTYGRNFPETLMCVAAYHTVAGAKEPLRAAAIDALRYAVATKFNLKTATLDAIHQAAESSLRGESASSADKISLEMAAATAFDERLEYLRKHWEDVRESLKPDEIEKLLGELLRGASKKGEQEKLVELRHTLHTLGYDGDALRQTDGRLLIALNAAVNLVMPRLQAMLDAQKQGADLDRARENVEVFRAMVSGGRFLGNRTDDVRKLQTWLVDLREGDVPDDAESMFRMFCKLDLRGQ
jgi:MoxR-like ATPase